MSDIKRGDVVVLKSDGPDMTVRLIVGEAEDTFEKMYSEATKRQGFKDGDIICQWFKGDEIVEKAFPKESLVIKND